jgi:glycerol-3-phosphate O-acyltransferase
MPERLTLRPVRPAPSWFAVPVLRDAEGGLAPELARGRSRVYLGHVPRRLDERILRASLERAGFSVYGFAPSPAAKADAERLRDAFLAGLPVLVPLRGSREGPDRLARLLAFARDAGYEAELWPVEVLWSPRGNASSLWNLLLGNPYDPPRPSRWARFLLGSRVRVLLGAPGTLSALAAQVREPGDAVVLAAHVRRQAVKAISLAARRAIGERYKVPRFVVDELVREPQFCDRVAAAGGTAGLTRVEALERAELALRELATEHNLFYLELFRRLARWLRTRAYHGEIAVDAGELEKLRELGRQSSLIFVPSHKSNLDHLVLYDLLYGSGFPPPHTAAGDNLAFFPLRRILRRTGGYFIRRSFQDDPIYKESLAAFVHYLVQRRFHQEFFIEGGRTRSGKLLPPRFGMLRYLVDACRQSDVDDARIVPVSISYDQVLEVDDYVRELRGEAKQRESLRSVWRMVRRLSARDLGRIYVSFGEPIPIRDALAGAPRLEVERLAFRVANEINAHLRMTAVASLCSALLGAGSRALTREEVEAQTARTLEFARERGIPLGLELAQGAAEGTDAALGALGEAGLVEVYAGGTCPVYRVPEPARHAASFYRNTVLHFFLARAIAALARLAAARAGRSVDDWALRLRELLKFEFFFRERGEFQREIARECAALEREPPGGTPLHAAGPAVLVDHLESYLVVAETLLAARGAAATERALLDRCHAIGRQLLLQGRVHSPELLSSANFKNGLRLAENLRAARCEGDGWIVDAPDTLARLAADLAELVTLARGAL